MTDAKKIYRLAMDMRNDLVETDEMAEQLILWLHEDGKTGTDAMVVQAQDILGHVARVRRQLRELVSILQEGKQ
jgi:hypothetical protein